MLSECTLILLPPQCPFIVRMYWWWCGHWLLPFFTCSSRYFLGLSRGHLCPFSLGPLSLAALMTWKGALPSKLFVLFYWQVCNCDKNIQTRTYLSNLYKWRSLKKNHLLGFFQNVSPLLMLGGSCKYNTLQPSKYSAIESLLNCVYMNSLSVCLERVCLAITFRFRFDCIFVCLCVSAHMLVYLPVFSSPCLCMSFCLFLFLALCLGGSCAFLFYCICFVYFASALP